MMFLLERFGFSLAPSGLPCLPTDIHVSAVHGSLPYFVWFFSMQPICQQIGPLLATVTLRCRPVYVIALQSTIA